MAARVIRVLALGVALMLHTPHKLFAAAYAPPIAMEVGPSVIAVGDAVGVTVRPATLPYFGGAKILISWTGSGETSALDTTYYLYYTANASFTGITPGVFDVFASADWSALSENMGLPASSCISTASAPASVTVVDVTNVVASAYHVAEGNGPVTLTAQMTPVNAPEKVFWEIDPYQGGGFFSTNQGLTTQFYFVGDRSSHRVAARCGTSSREVVIHIYRVTGITATPQPAVAGESITLTAITEPANCPLPITWNISTNTGATITNAFGPGTHRVVASLGAGTITQTIDVVSVGVKEILYEWPANSENWLPWTGLATGFPPLPTTAAVAVGSSFRVKAMPEPEGAEFPAGWPVWSGAASGSGPIATATFASVSTNLSDYQSVTATSGTSSHTEQAVVFGIDSILVATNHVAIGTNTLTLAPQMTPSSGGEHLVVWDCTNATLTLGSGASVEFPCDQAGVFTATATCGGSAASTNLFVYRVMEVIATPSLVVASEPVPLSATTEPASCPLPITWNVSTNTGATITNSFAAGHHTVVVTLGSSAADCALTSVTVGAIKYEAVPDSGDWLAWPAPAFFPKGSTFRVRAIPNPYDPNKTDAEQWPSGKPVWGGAASGTGPITTATFGVTSTNATDFKLITAECSDTQMNAAIVYEWVPNIEPMVNFTNRATNRFGVGEDLNFSIRIIPTNLQPATVGEFSWIDGGEGGILNGDGYPSGTTSFGSPEAATWIFPSAWHLPSVFSGNAGAATTVTEPREIIAPDEVRFYPRPSATEENNLFHLALKWNIRVVLMFHVKPRDVSWDNVRFKEEGGELAVATGWLEPYNGRPHVAATNWVPVVRDANVPPLHFGASPDMAETPILGQGLPYPVSSDGFQPPGNVPPYATGNFRWDIGWMYCVHRGGVKSANEHRFAIVPQVFTSDENGTATARKGNFGPIDKTLLEVHEYLSPDGYVP